MFDGPLWHTLACLVLFGGVTLGHLVLLVTTHNWLYGQPFPHRVSDIIHLSHAAAFLALPLGLFLGWGLDLSPLLGLATKSPAEWALAGYLVFCLFTACVLFPANVIQRLPARPPAVLVETRSEVVDVARELGKRPEGTCRDRNLTRLPGNEALTVELAEHTLALPRLPRTLDGLTILHLTDLHLRGTPDRDYFRYVLDRCAAWEPDLVAITGDVVDSDEHYRWVVPLLGRVRWRVGALAVLGNHDLWHDPDCTRKRLRRIGVSVLGNDWRQVVVRGEPLVVVGNERPWFGPTPDLSDCPDAPFRLCLSHTPDNLPWAKRQNIDLMLAGHVHGGQIRFPVIGSVFVPSVFGRRYDQGLFHEGPTVMYVGRGLSGAHPLRFGCRPEVTLLTLRSATDG